MIRTIADQYLAQNAGRRFPFADDTVGLDDNAVLDFRCVVRDVPPGYTPNAALVGIDDVTKDSIACKCLTVSLAANGASLGNLLFYVPKTIADTANYHAVAHTEYADGEIVVTRAILSADGDMMVPFSATTVVSDGLKVDSIASASSGTELRNPTTDVPLIDPETGNKYVMTAVLTGDIVIDSGYNAEPYLDGNNLRLDIYKGAGVGEFCQTETSGQTCGNVLFTINGERPGSDGNIRIVGKNGITVTPYPKEHVVEINMSTVAAETVAKKCDRTC